MQRERSFDVFRGLAIIFVVAIHASNSGVEWYGSLIGEWNFYLTLLTKQLYVCAVPVLFFVSGYFFESKASIPPLTNFQHVLKKLKRILIPYFFWSCFIIVLDYGNLNAIDVIEALVLGRAQGPYYFLITLSCFLVITPLIFSIGLTQKTFITIVVLNFSTLVLIYFLRISIEGGIAWQYVNLPFTTWIVFYYLGLITREFKLKAVIRQLNTKKKALIALVVSFIMSQIEAFFLVDFFGIHAGGVSEVRVSSFLYSLCVINLFLVVKDSHYFRQSKLLNLIGRYSFGVFLIHELIRGQISSLMSEIEWLNAIQLLFQLTTIFITLILCIVFINLTKLVIGEKVASKYLGF